MEPKACCHCAPKPWYREKLFYIVVLTIALLVLSYNVTLLHPFFDTFMDYLKIIWWAILLGILVSGIIEHYIPQEYIMKYLSQHKKRTILHATLFGFLMTVCSHGVLAIAIQLYKKGASIPAVVAFLLASPWANFTMTILLFGFFGLKALLIIFSAIIIAIITGLIYQLLEKKKLIEQSKPVTMSNNFSIRADLKKRYKNYRFTLEAVQKDVKGILRGSKDISKMILWWILIGMILASAAGAFIPVHIFHQYMGPTIIGLLITLAIATVIEVCSEGSSPLAFEIYRQTGALGNSFTFLMAGVATDYTEIGLLWSNIGKKTALWLPIITVPQILVFAVVFNVVF